MSNRVNPVGARHPDLFVQLLAELLPRQLAADRAWHNCVVRLRLAACPHRDPQRCAAQWSAARGTQTRPLNGVRTRKGYREVRLKRPSCGRGTESERERATVTRSRGNVCGTRNGNEDFRGAAVAVEHPVMVSTFMADVSRRLAWTFRAQVADRSQIGWRALSAVVKLRGYHVAFGLVGSPHVSLGIGGPTTRRP